MTTTVRLAKFLVPVVAVVGCYFAISGSSTIVALLLMGYNFVTQLFPILICSLMRRNPATKEGAFAGILAGVATVVYFTLAHQSHRQAAAGPAGCHQGHQCRLRCVIRQRDRALPW